MTIYVAGDIHGSKESVENIISQIDNPTKNDIIIVAGDAGLEYGSHIMGSAKQAMQKFPGTWVIMRGNHDTRYFRDHTSATGWPKAGWERMVLGNNEFLFQQKYLKICYIRDNGGLYKIQGKNFLFIPGAYSIDKQYRILNNLPYESKEQLTYTEFCDLIEIAEENADNIDYVVSHTCPYSLEPYIEDLFLSSVHQSQVDKTTERWLDEFKDILEPHIKHWYFGHYHDDRTILDKYSMLFQNIAKVD